MRLTCILEGEGCEAPLKWYFCEGFSWQHKATHGAGLCIQELRCGFEFSIFNFPFSIKQKQAFGERRSARARFGSKRMLRIVLFLSRPSGGLAKKEDFASAKATDALR